MKTYSGAATKWAQQTINCHAAQTGCALRSMGMYVAFLNGPTFKGIIERTRGPLRFVLCDCPPAYVGWLRKLTGMDGYGNGIEVVDSAQAMWGLKDAPRAFGMRLRRALRDGGYAQGITVPQARIQFKRAIGATGSGHSASAVGATGSCTGDPEDSDAIGATGAGLQVLEVFDVEGVSPLGMFADQHRQRTHC